MNLEKFFILTININLKIVKIITNFKGVLNNIYYHNFFLK